MIKAAYKTKQQDLILSYLRTIKGNHFTAEDIKNHFAQKEINIGVATVYRQLEKFVSEGIVQKYFIDERSACCFEFIGDDSDCLESRHYHLKCELCGLLIHLECDELNEIGGHLKKNHGFTINPFRTVIYGICESCNSKKYK